MIVTEVGNHRVRRVELNPGTTPPPNDAALLVMELNPSLVIYGTVGKTYQIEYSQTETLPLVWIPITEVSLSKSPQVWTDPRPASGIKRIYRAVLKN